MFFASLVEEISDSVVPRLILLQQRMIAAVVGDELSADRSATLSPSPFPYSPAILLCLKRIVKAVYSICPNEDMTELLIRTYEMSVVMLMRDQSACSCERYFICFVISSSSSMMIIDIMILFSYTYTI